MMDQPIVEYDEKRCGWWFRGLGFEFMAYFTLRGYLEADVHREGESPDQDVHIAIPLPPSGRMTEDLFATAALKQLRRFWPIPPVILGKEAP